MDYCKWIFWMVILIFVLAVIQFIYVMAQPNQIQHFTAQSDGTIKFDNQDIEYLKNMKANELNSLQFNPGDVYTMNFLPQNFSSDQSLRKRYVDIMNDVIATRLANHNLSDAQLDKYVTLLNDITNYSIKHNIPITDPAIANVVTNQTEHFTVTGDRKLHANAEERAYLLNLPHGYNTQYGLMTDDQRIDAILNTYSNEVGHLVDNGSLAENRPQEQGLCHGLECAGYYASTYSGIQGMNATEFAAFQKKLQSCEQQYPHEIDLEIKCDGFQ